MREPAGQSPVVSNSVPALANGSSAGSERVLLLECRLEKLSSALNEARADADRLRGRLADGAAREAEHARRFSAVHQELAEARAEIASLHEQLNHSEALRAKLEGHLFEAGATADTAELLKLRQELAVQKQRAEMHEQTAARQRRRVDELLTTRDALLSRMAEWQRLVHLGNSEAVDLGEFMASLRQDVMVLENRNAEAERRELELRERLARAGVNLEAAPAIEEATAEAPAPAPVAPSAPEERSEPPATKETQLDALTFEGLLGTTREPESEHDLFDEPEAEPEPAMAAAVAAVPESEASFDGIVAPVVETVVAPVVVPQVADQLRSGLVDLDPRVRRRAVLTAAMAPDVELRPLLEPLRSDPDPQVRRVVREVLRHAPATEHHVHESAELD